MADLSQRFTRTAELLSARKVLVRFRLPPVAGMAGEAYRPEDAPGLNLIDIRPDLPEEERFRVFLHETAHVAAGHVDQVKPTTKAQEVSGAVQLARPDTSEYATKISQKREAEADALARIWREWAERKIVKHITPGDPWPVKEAGMLAALEFWRQTL